ncbi:hypothetical protein EXU48_11680 [Occultella glacieicola]|uniref:Restriction endonuclease type II-like domain-containing protein n=1 Tax=Occultella glacieicola TaxID=2518684 RepID=A0ABY2E3C2_9MICO|nr:hypothetical protein [Occultella glacieicola]TDE94100.1 hypothetical protein EXU48_11680 [Occultella glacieicola]
MTPPVRFPLPGGRKASSAPQPPEVEPTAPEPTARERAVSGAAAQWRNRLADLAGGSALWDVDALGDALVDLTAAHPSGIAQLFAGRATRLSNLVREGSALTQARRRARVMGARTEELAQRYGVAPTYVAVGVATWRAESHGEHSDAAPGRPAPGPDEGSTAQPGSDPAAARGSESAAQPDPDATTVLAEDAGTTPALAEDPATPASGTRAPAPRLVHAPVLLRPVRLTGPGSDAEIDLELDPAVELNSVLVRELRAHGVDLDPAEIARSTMGTHGFSPSPALATIAELGKALPEFRMDSRIIVGAFVHPGQALADDLEAQQSALAAHDVVAALAGDDEAKSALRSTLPSAGDGDRDPGAERGAGDLDAGQHRVLDAVGAGGHVLVDAPPGVDVPATVTAVVAQAAAEGKRVLYVPGTRRAARALLDAMRAVGVGDLALDLSNDPSWNRTAARRLVDGLNPPEPSVDPAAVAKDREALLAARTKLAGYINALHTPRPPWSASAYQALQALAELTAQRPGPRTQVRLSGTAVRSMDSDERERAREELARAGALGAFQLRASDTPWFGAELTSADHATATLADVRALNEVLPRLREQVDAAAAQTGLDEAQTLEQWSEQLTLLDGIQSSLDVFTPQVFERSATDMVAATASRAWRAQHQVDLAWGARRRLRKQAKDLLRPGVTVGDLHAELVEVATRRDVWRRHCAGGGWPRVPEGMTAIVRTAQEVTDLVGRLAPVLAPTLGGRTLSEVPLAELANRIERLGTDDAAVRQMPERAAVIAKLNGLGLAPLVADLGQRRVPTSLVGAEFDLAWWSSVLEEMLAEDPAMAGLEAESLDEAAARLRALDETQTASLVAPVLAGSAARVRAAISADRPRAQEFYRTVMRGATDLKALLNRFGEVAWAPRPVWIVPPMVVPQVLPPGRDVDLLVLDAVQHLPVEQVISAIVRAKQVVVFGDTRRGGTGTVRALDLLPRATLPGDRVDQDTDIAAFLARHGYADIIRPVPAPPHSPRITLDLVDGTGMPAPGSDVVESVQAEVDRVVDLVIDHALTRPEQSLAVIALNSRHADRVREAVLSTAAGSTAMSAFFDQSGTDAFTVVDIESVAGLRRDAIIFSLGYGKTPHGRVLHRFGAVSGRDGAEYLVDALDAVRHRFTVVSCLAAEDLDPARLRSEGSRMLKDVLALAAAGRAELDEDTDDHAPDRLLVDLAERLWRLGLTVVPRYGVPGGVRIPLAIGHPDLPGELLVAVLTDDPEYVAEPSLRRRDRHWVQRLQNRGWRVRMVFSTAVFMDPQGEAERIAQDVRAVLAERNVTVTSPASGIPPTDLVDEVAGEEEPDRDSAARPTTSARGIAMVGEQPTRPGTRSPIAGLRGDRPDVPPGQPLSRYGDDELDALVGWLASDGEPRSSEALREELRAELGIAKRGTHVDAVLGAAVRRSGLGSAPDSPAATDATRAAGEADGGDVTGADGSPPAEAAAAADDELAGNAEAAGNELAGDAEAADDELAGDAEAADDEPVGNAEAADDELAGDAQAAGEEPADDTQGDGGADAGSTDAHPDAPRTGTAGRAEPTIPNRAWEDEDRAWGEGSSDSDDERLRRDVPPHWS